MVTDLHRHLIVVGMLGRHLSCWASDAKELRGVMEFGSGRSSDFRTVRSRHRCCEESRGFEPRDLAVKLPMFTRESSASSPVNSARDLELGDPTMIAVPLSCEDFDEDNCTLSMIAVPLSCEDFDDDDWNL